MIAPVNNVVTNNDVAPSHRLRRMDSVSSIEISKVSKVSKVSNSGRSIPKMSKYRDTTKYRYRTFASIAILRYFWYRTSTIRYHLVSKHQISRLEVVQHRQQGLSQLWSIITAGIGKHLDLPWPLPSPGQPYNLALGWLRPDLPPCTK